MKNFLCNEENKQQLVKLMHICWSEMVIEEQIVILGKECDAFQISSEQEGQFTISELKSNQQKTDTGIMLPNKDISMLETEALIVISS